jgi:ParB-like chromosome segregation protein Spo0J
MRKTKNKNRIIRIPTESFVPHPDHSNRMSKMKFAKLVRNVERTGRYEPLVVRPCPATNCHSCGSRNPDEGAETRRSCFQIINGYHRWKALRQLDYKTVDAVVWDIDDKDTDILLATLNHLGGSDVLEKKLALMSRLNQCEPARDLAKLLPHTANQIHRLAQMHSGRIPRIKQVKPTFAHPVVFFLNDAQKEILEKALSKVQETKGGKTRAAKKAAALTTIARRFNVKS